MRARAALAAVLLAALALPGRADVPGSTPGVDCLCPRAPGERLPELRAQRNPFERSAANLARGRDLYLGKGFCAVCHGRDGHGFGPDVDRSRLRGVLPRDFSDRDWQAVRTDGEIHWVIANGVSGTAMAPFVPGVLSAEEAWLVVLWLRTRAPRTDADASAAAERKVPRSGVAPRKRSPRGGADVARSEAKPSVGGRP
jgi:mono/diheme cytochrome c family protein